jgi:hypothetical protein
MPMVHLILATRTPGPTKHSRAAALKSSFLLPSDFVYLPSLMRREHRNCEHDEDVMEITAETGPASLLPGIKPKRNASHLLRPTCRSQMIGEPPHSNLHDWSHRRHHGSMSQTARPQAPTRSAESYGCPIARPGDLRFLNARQEAKEPRRNKVPEPQDG